jgi:3'(2'), 5'-bisphosphate nucleotidase
MALEHVVSNMPAIDLTNELRVAIAAVRKAAAVCSSVQDSLGSADKLQKQDLSPVTVADFASQAVICAALAAGSAVDRVMAEESATELRKAECDILRAKVIEQARSALGQTVAESDVLDLIDRGAWRPDTPAQSYWTLDPVDGTKGFIRCSHYAIALALIDCGQVVLGVLACPKLRAFDGSPGTLATAVRGQGAKAHPLTDDTSVVTLGVADVHRLSQALLCESVEPGHSDQTVLSEVKTRLGLALPSLRLDGQVKYVALANGQASIYLRIPKRDDYLEKVWDHAAGSLIVEEAGGVVTDVAGKPLDFSQGEILPVNHGIVAAGPGIHDAVLKTVQEVVGGR